MSLDDESIERSKTGIPGLDEILHGGTIEASSDGPGQGSQFVVRLPVNASDVTGQRAADGDAGPVAAAARRVLVADDDKDAADALAMLLELAGH